jgi:Ca2+-binding RTX toxin-like protein
MSITGTSSDDAYTGTSGDDTFDLSQGGNDTASGANGDDIFQMGATLGALDTLDGGGGTDHVLIDGDYSGGNALVFGATTLTSIEYLQLAGGHNYTLTMNDGNLGLTHHMHIDASRLGASDVFFFDASAEVEGIYTISAGKGTNTLIGGQNQAFFYFQDGAMLGTDDTIVGHGLDTVLLSGDYSAGLTFLPTTMTGVYSVTLDSGFSYDLTTDDATVAAGQTLVFYAGGLGSGDSVRIDASAETNGTIIFNGGAGLNVLVGGAKADLFGFENNGQTRFDTFTASDQIDGGAGNDTLFLTGDYSAGLVFGPATMINVERIQLNDAYDYDLTTDDATVAAGKTLEVDASYLPAGQSLAFNGSAESDGGFVVETGTGDDTIVGGAKHDVFFFAGSFTATDTLKGGAGSDRLDLNGNYSAPVFFTATTMQKVEVLKLHAGHSYNLNLVDATVGAGKTLQVLAGTLGSSATLTFNGAFESDGRFVVKAGSGDDTVRTGAGDDVVKGGSGDDQIANNGGVDTIAGNNGADTISLGATLTAADTINGGKGHDIVMIVGANYASGLTFAATTMVKVEELLLGSGASYNLTTDEATVAAGKTLTVAFTPSPLGPGGALIFDGSHETDGRFHVTTGTGNDDLVGGAADDVLTAGDGDDRLTGGAGADKLDGGTGADVFVYAAVSESTSDGRDKIDSVDFDSDRFDLSVAVNAVDTAVTTGQLRSAHFDHDLHDALVGGHLHAHHAVLFTADSGGLSGHTFLVVDMNGSGGYQAAQDLVVQVDGASGTLTAGDFI